MVKTNELRKGTRIQLRNGWYATLVDNKKGNIRDATVEGYVTETGSVYAHDITYALLCGEWVEVEHTPTQLALKNVVENIL